VDAVPDPLLRRKFGNDGNRTPGPGLAPGTLATRPQRRSLSVQDVRNVSRLNCGLGTKLRYSEYILCK
jgi:hypothetical protein